jgi:hypothetical protein
LAVDSALESLEDAPRLRGGYDRAAIRAVHHLLKLVVTRVVSILLASRNPPSDMVAIACLL